MNKDGTVKLTADGFELGDKLYQKRARKALSILIRQTKAEQPITYKNLGDELDMPNARNLNYVLGSIGNELKKLSKEWNIEIPPIQFLVVNKNTGLPGEGIGDFYRDWANSSTKRKRLLLEKILNEVFLFDRWDDVLIRYKLEPEKGIRISPRVFKRLEKGESPLHRRLKEFISENPNVIGFSKSLRPGITEFLMPSSDAIDVLFKNGGEWIGVEVKSRNSDENDIQRGLYQCIKYEALLNAMQVTEGMEKNVRVMLVLESEFPNNLISIKNILGIEVIDSIKVKSD